MGKVWIALAVVFSLCAIATGGFFGASFLFATRDTAAFTVRQPVREVAIDGGGDVHVVASSNRSSVSVERKNLSFVDHPDTSWSVADGVLRLDSRCGTDWGPFTRCGTKYTVLVPATTPVSVRSDHGDVDVDGAAEAIRVESEHGDVEGSDLTSAAVVASADHGDVHLEFGRRPERVRATSNHGDVHVVVPVGEYRVEASTSHGDVHVQGVVRNDRSTHLLAVHSDHGDVAVSGE